MTDGRHSIILDDTVVTIAVSPSTAIPWLPDWLSFFPRSRDHHDPLLQVRPSGRERFLFSTRAGSVDVGASDLEPLFDQSLRALLRHTGQRPLMHGALIGNGAHAIAITGPSGAGKTALVRALARNGAGYWSDEYVLMSHAGVMGYPRCLELGDDDVEPLRAWQYRTATAGRTRFGHLFGLMPPRWIPWRNVRGIVHLASGFDEPLRFERTRFRRPLWHRPARTDLWPVLSQLRRRPHYNCSGGSIDARSKAVTHLLHDDH
ncbi:MAG: hypothetical protein D6761_09650 [Candidatus Dadabacteria bacterium]|nr:MAG: hypothetical protein D6761_09650 [Candidatus Dadabacteria bacterium]